MDCPTLGSSRHAGEIPVAHQVAPQTKHPLLPCLFLGVEINIYIPGSQVEHDSKWNQRLKHVVDNPLFGVSSILQSSTECLTAQTEHARTPRLRCPGAIHPTYPLPSAHRVRRFNGGSKPRATLKCHFARRQASIHVSQEVLHRSCMSVRALVICTL